MAGRAARPLAHASTARVGASVLRPSSRKHRGPERAPTHVRAPPGEVRRAPTRASPAGSPSARCLGSDGRYATAGSSQGRGQGWWARLRWLLHPEGARSGRRQRFLQLGGLALLAGFALLAVRSVDVEAVGVALAAADPSLVIAAMCGNLLSLAAHAGRWVALLPRAAERARFRDAFSAMNAGFAVSIVAPARAGDVVRAWILARRTGTSTATGVAVAGLDYVIGAATLAPLLALLALAVPVPPWARHALLAFAAAATAGIGLALWLRPRGAHGLPVHAAGRLAARLRAGFAASGDPAALSVAAAWGLAGWGAELLIAYLSLAALGIPADLVRSSLVVVASTAAGVVAVSPGGAGPYELAVVLALAGTGVAREPALAAALLHHLVHLAPVAVIGSVVLVRELRGEPAERAP